VKRVWALDLDNTLYPANNGLFPLIDARIIEYMTVKVGVSEEEVHDLRARYRRDYGLTIIGLMNHHGVDPDDYSRYVHDVPLDNFLVPDLELVAWLNALPGTRVIFTNGSVAHAQAVLSRLGALDAMSGIFDLAFMDYVPKPQPHGYRKLMKSLGVAPRQCCLIDDLSANLDTALALGMETVLVGSNPSPPHRHVKTVLDLVPDDWQPDDT
jgi:putative hydrolase of the HAD superfamily